MATTTVLQDALQSTHREIATRLDAARAVESRPEQTRRGCPPIDLFLSGTSMHLHAVGAVLLPEARRSCEDGAEFSHDYLQAARGLEVMLAHVKAHEYGSAYETSFDWDAVWGEVEDGLAEQWQLEADLGQRLADGLPEERLDRLVEQLRTAEQHAPTRPHPYLPHTGASGAVSRNVMKVADSFWDAVEGRFVPKEEKPPKKKPGLIGQYVMAQPHIDDEERDREGR